MDRAGRVVVPKELRRALQMPDGGPIDIVERSGVIEIRPATTPVEIIETPEGPVARTAEHPGGGSGTVLTDEMVRDTLEQIRR